MSTDQILFMVVGINILFMVVALIYHSGGLFFTGLLGLAFSMTIYPIYLAGEECIVEAKKMVLTTLKLIAILLQGQKGIL